MMIQVIQAIKQNRKQHNYLDCKCNSIWLKQLPVIRSSSKSHKDNNSVTKKINNSDSLHNQVFLNSVAGSFFMKSEKLNQNSQNNINQRYRNGDNQGYYEERKGTIFFFDLTEL